MFKLSLQNLSSKKNGIAGVAPRLSTCAVESSRKAVAAVVEVECADGRRGGKLKTRKVRYFPMFGNAFESVTR